MRCACRLSAIFWLLFAAVAIAATVRYPPRGDSLFKVVLPDGWRPRAVEATNEIRADSPARDVELSIETSDASVDDRSLDDAIARRMDKAFTKLEFSNLHQRRLVNGRRFVVFRGFGRERTGGAKTSFEIFAFPVNGKTGILFFRYRKPSAKTTEAVQAIVESVEPTNG